MGIFQIRNIHSDLMKLQQGLIDNNYSGQRKLMIYFMWAYKKDRKWHAINQIKILCRYSCINSVMFRLMNFYTEIYQENDNKVKSSR
jgi:hypothetical protein